MWADRLDQKLNDSTRRVGVYLFALALTVHVCYLCEYARTPFFWAPELDSLYDDLAATSIAAGHIGHAPFFRAPGYLYFLAGIYRLFGHNYWAARLVQAILGSASVALLYRLGSQLLRPSVGLIAAVSMALYGPLVFNDGELHTPVLEVFLDIAMLNVAVNLRSLSSKSQYLRMCLTAGILISLSAVTRPNILITLPVIVWWIAVDARSRRRAAVGALAFLTAASIFPILVTVRNWRVSGDPVFIASQGGINLYLGNRAGADGFTPSTPTRYRFDDVYEDSVALYGQKAAEEAAGHRLTASQAQSYWVSRSLAWWRTSPLDAVRLTGRKLVLAWTYREIRNNTAYAFARRELAPFLWVCAAGFWIAGPLSIVGMVLGRRESAVRRLTAFTLAYLAGIVPFFMADRYRLTVVPVLLLISAYSIVTLVDILSRSYRQKRLSTAMIGHSHGQWQRLSIPALALVLGILLCDVNWVRTETPKTWAIDYWSMGNRYVRLGEYAKAEGPYRKALRLNPANGDVWNGLGEALYDQGRVGEAAHCFRQAILTGPDRPRAAYNEALCHEAAGDNANAARLLQFALADDPEYVRARRELDDLNRRCVKR